MSIPTPACLLCLSPLTLDNGSPHRSGLHLPTRPALWNLVFELSRPACQCIVGGTSWQPSIASATSSESLVVLQFRRSPARAWSSLLRDVLPCPCSPQPSHRPFTPRQRPSSYFCRVSHGPSLGRAQPPSAANTPTFRTPVSPRPTQTPLHPGAPIVPLHQSMPVNHPVLHQSPTRMSPRLKQPPPPHLCNRVDQRQPTVITSRSVCFFCLQVPIVLPSPASHASGVARPKASSVDLTTSYNASGVARPKASVSS